MFVVNGKLIEKDEARFYLDEDSICYGCYYYAEDGGCDCIKDCVEGNMNGYRMEG